MLLDSKSIGYLIVSLILLQLKLPSNLRYKLKMAPMFYTFAHTSELAEYNITGWNFAKMDELGDVVKLEIHFQRRYVGFCMDESVLRCNNTKVIAGMVFTS